MLFYLFSQLIIDNNLTSFFGGMCEGDFKFSKTWEVVKNFEHVWNALTDLIEDSVQGA